MFTAALLTTAKTQKQPKCPSTDDWIDELRYAHATEYYSANKRDEALYKLQQG